MMSPPQTQTALYVSSAKQEPEHTMMSQADAIPVLPGNTYFAFVIHLFWQKLSCTRICLLFHHAFPAFLTWMWPCDWIWVESDVDHYKLRKTREKLSQEDFPTCSFTPFQLTEVEATPRKTWEVRQYYNGRDWHIGVLIDCLAENLTGVLQEREINF